MARLNTTFNATIIVAGTNITNNAARIAVKEERNGIFDTYIRADCPNPLTMTKEREAIKNVNESLSPTFKNPITIPRITRKAYGVLLYVISNTFCDIPIIMAKITPIRKAYAPKRFSRDLTIENLL